MIQISKKYEYLTIVPYIPVIGRCINCDARELCGKFRCECDFDQYYKDITIKLKKLNNL